MEEIAESILKTDAQGGIVRLKDVAKVELGLQAQGHARLNGKPAVVLAVYPIPQATLADVTNRLRTKLVQLRKRFPDGLDINLAFEFTPLPAAPARPAAAEYLLVDVNLPANASTERVLNVLVP